MKRTNVSRIFKIACVVSLAFGAWPPSVAHAAPSRADLPPVYISEIAWAGSSRSTADEWLELANAGDVPITVDGWRLEGAGDKTKPLVFPANSILPAHGTFLVANYDLGDTRTALTAKPDMVTTTISLSNETMLIRLLDGAGQVLDQAGDGEKPLAGYSSDIKASMIRTTTDNLGDNAEAWTTATTSKNMNTADLGTPGAVDLGIPMPNNDTGINATAIQTENASTTELLIDPVATSTSISTDEIIEQNSWTSSTEPEIIMDSEANDATSTLAEVQTLNPSTPQNQGLVSNQIFVRLNEVMTNPSEGSEWIEVVSAVPDRTMPLEGLELHDAVGKIMRLTGMLSPTNTTLTIDLSSARFNNSGDSIYIKDASGNALDTLVYAESEEGWSWARDAQGAWRMTSTPTPGATNQITSPTVAAVEKTSSYEPVTPKQTAKATTTKTTTKTSKASSTVKTVAMASATTTKDAKPKTTKVVTAKSSTSTKSMAKSSTTKTKIDTTTPILNSDIDMLIDDDIGGIRVALEGTVGSPLRLVSGHAFVLLNQQGRGLMVRVPTKMKLPEYGASIRVTGTLKFDTRDIPYLSMAKDDGWSAMKKPFPIPQPKSDVLLEAPAAEDVWALTATTGTVVSVSGSTLVLATDGADVNVKIRPGVPYRISRLKAGDVIQVKGLLDTSGDLPAILPRKSEEIQIVSHAAPKTEATITENKNATTPTYPGWTPFGAAALAVGMVQGVKTIKSKLGKNRAMAKT